jgi:glycosyltransferase involved in cell wall biosynthesis
MKKILMIAFHYPPYQGSSGVLRTLKFSRYLPHYGWQPIILTANPRAYPKVSSDQLFEIPSDVKVKRTFALDTARHLAVLGSYLKWMALPDRWVSWLIGAIPSGLLMIHKFKPDVIWSTYPVATAHLIGYTLHRLTGIPWVADFRDPMTEDVYPPDPAVWKAYRWIERHTAKYCTYGVFTTPGTLRMYAERYPEIPSSRWKMIANGYDQNDFVAMERDVVNGSSHNGRIMLVHSGLLYPSERNPNAFFDALAELKTSGKISSSNLKIILRGSGNEDYYQRRLRENGINDIVFLESPVPHRKALEEMLNADGLLIFQASNCNQQIPAKIYEYLRSKRPIFAMTDPSGDTADLLRTSGINTMVALDSREQIMKGLLDFLIQIQEGCAPIANDKEIECYSRKSRTQELVNLLDSLI